jgi:hypothetical protein
VENHDENESDDNDSDESVDVEDTSSDVDVDEKTSPASSPSRLPNHAMHNNNNEDLLRSNVTTDESFKGPLLQNLFVIISLLAKSNI